MARRVNSKFLIIFSIIVVGGVLSAYLLAGPLKNYVRGDRSKKLIEQADALVKEASAPNVSAEDKKEKLISAVRDYTAAASTDTKNPELFLKLGDASSRLTQYDVIGYIKQSRFAWEKALEIEPRYVPALHRLMDSYYKEVQIGNGISAATFSKLQEFAKSIHASESKDLRANALMYIAPLNQWLANIETPPNDIKIAVDELTKLITDNPTSTELPDMVFFVAAAKARLGVEDKRRGLERQGNGLLAEAVEVFQGAEKVQNDNPALHYRFFEVLSYLRANDFEREPQLQYTRQLKAELDQARKLVTPEDETFVKVYIAANQIAASERNPNDKVASNLLLDLYKAKPDDQRVRLALAKFWRFDPKKRDEAIALLEQPMVDTGWVGVEALLKMDLELQSWAELDNMYIERFATLPEAERPAGLKRIQEVYDQLYAKAHDRSDVLKIRGKIELLRGGVDAPVTAINTFVKAQSRYQAEHNNKEDLDLTFLLARSYLASRQYGSARTQLIKFKDRNPDFIPVRMMLAQVLIREGSTPEARAEVEFLEKQAPEEPEVLRLLLAVLDPVKDAAKVKATFAKLPEANRDQQMSKAMIANLSPILQPGEAVRLYKAVLAADPGDFEALQGVKDVLLSQDKKAEALELLKAGQKAKPSDDKIALIVKQMEGASTEDIKKLSEELIRKQYTNDPLGLELKLYEFHLIASSGPTAEEQKHAKEEAFKHLLAAEKIKPDDGRVQDLLFQYHLNERNWEKANEYADKLGAANFDQAHGLIYKFRVEMTRGDIAKATSIARELTQSLDQFARSWVFLGQALQADKKYEEAINAYNLALDKQSDNPEALAGNIACYYQRGQPTEVVRYIEKGMAAHPNNLFFKKQWESYQLSQWGDASKLIDPTKEERDANPKDPNRWIALGRAQYTAARKHDKDMPKYIADAKATFTEALKQWPGEKIIWAFLSEIADFNNDAAGGEALLKEMMARPEFKDSTEPALMLADHYLRHDAPKQCEATMKAALEKFKTGKDGDEVRRRLAAYYTQNKRFDDALALLDPASPDKLVRQQIVEIYMLQASIEKKPELFTKAETLVRSMLTANPDDAQLNALLGVVLLNKNEEEHALEAFGTALKLDPKNQAALYTRGQLRLKGKQVDAAIADLVALRDVNPNHLEARVSLSEAYRLKGNTEEAARELEFVINKVPARKDARITLAGIYAGAKPTPMWGDAERVINEGERLEPNDALWKRMQAKMYAARGATEKGMYDKAAVKIVDAIRQDPKNGELIRDYLDIMESGKMWDHLLTETNRMFAADKNIADTGWSFYVKRGVALRHLGQTNEATADFDKAMAIVEADKTATQDSLIAIIDKMAKTLGSDVAITRVTRLSNTPGPKATRWKVVLAYLYMNSKDRDFDQAARLIEEARTEAANLDERNQATALNVAGTIYMMSGKYDLSRARFEELLAKKPDDIAALNNLAFLMAEDITPPNLPKALEYSQRAMDIMNKNKMNEPNILDTYGWVNVLIGGANLETGIENLNKSIAASEIPEAYYHLGEAMMKKRVPPEIAKGNFVRANELIKARMDADENVDANFKKKVDDALQRVEKSLGTAAGNQ